MLPQFGIDQRQLKSGRIVSPQGQVRSAEGRQYDIEEFLGKGGNASVFRCLEAASGTEYAIKFQGRTGRQSNQRFRREVRLVKSMQAKNSIQYVDSGTEFVTRAGSEDRVPVAFLITELADQDLQSLIAANGPMKYVDCAGQIRGLAAALAALHDHEDQPVHRDIKPENILIAGDRWVLADYGLCSVVAEGDADLTPPDANVGPKFWLSPEAHHRRLRKIDRICAASDVFQLAAVFWYVVTGRHPTGVVCRPDWTGPEKLFAPLHRALQHDLERRPRNGSEFHEEIAAALAA